MRAVVDALAIFHRRGTDVGGEHFDRHRLSLEGGVAVGAEPFVAVFGDGHDLFAAVAADAVDPDDRFEHERHAGHQLDGVLVLEAELGPDERRFGGVTAGAVREVELLQPVLGFDGRRRRGRCRRTFAPV